MKRKLFIFLALLLLVIILAASCFGGKKALPPGKYEVLQAVYEASDNDYELQVKNYGEYDIARLKVETNPTQAGMSLEIKQDGSHILYVKSESDIMIDQDSSSSFKKKKKKR